MFLCVAHLSRDLGVNQFKILDFLMAAFHHGHVGHSFTW